MCDYPGRWPLFFDDILQSLTFGVAAVGMYLRVLMAIDSEVVDREIVHTVEVISHCFVVLQSDIFLSSIPINNERQCPSDI